MNKKIDYAARDKMIDGVLKKHRELDDICHEIFFTLMAYKKLRFNELLRALKKLGIKITQPTLSEHLPHLIEKELIERKEEGFQNVSYKLTEEIRSLLDVSQEDIEEWVKNLEKSGKKLLPVTKIVASMKSGAKNYYNNLSEEQIEKEIDRELNQVLKYFLDELKNYIQHDLRLGKQESDESFWKLIGNPMYRMREKRIAEDCRTNEAYKKRLFEKIDILINELRNDKELFTQRNTKVLKE